MLNNLPLKRATPENAGISSRELLKLIRELDSLGNEVHGWMVARNDLVCAEGWMAPYRAELPHSCHSLGKSYTCTAAGIACTEGLLHPDDRLTDLFSEEIQRMRLHIHPGMEKVTVRHLMTMSSGTKGMPRFDDQWLVNFLESEMADEPGSRFYYNTTGSCVLGAAVEKATGRDLLSYMREKLFRHIGIGEQDLVWQRFRNGLYAEPGICATTEANLRLGLLYLHEGMADDQQLISREWIREAVSKQIETGKNPASEEGSHGYGWQLWMGTVPGLYRFDGGQGQLCFVYPPKKCVIAMHQAGRDPYGVENSIRIVSAFMRELPDEPLAADPEGCDELENYLRKRSIPAGSVCCLTAKDRELEGVYFVQEGKLNPWIEVVPVEEDFWHYFYDPAVNDQVRMLEVRMNEEEVRLIFDRRTVIRARLDGRWHMHRTENVLPGLDAYSAVAEATCKMRSMPMGEKLEASWKAPVERDHAKRSKKGLDLFR